MPTFLRTRSGLRNPAAGAVLKFNVLIISAVSNIAAQSDFEKMSADLEIRRNE